MLSTTIQFKCDNYFIMILVIAIIMMIIIIIIIITIIIIIIIYVIGIISERFTEQESGRLGIFIDRIELKNIICENLS